MYVNPVVLTVICGVLFAQFTKVEYLSILIEVNKDHRLFIGPGQIISLIYIFVK